jgi:uncharacterized membrane protein YkoI
MASARFATAALLAFACVLTLAPAHAQDATQDAANPAQADAEHACLDQKERRAEADSGRLVPLAAAMHAAKSRMSGTVVRARLCHGQSVGQDGLVYVLTVLAHDGKVGRITVNATNGTLVGER